MNKLEFEIGGQSRGFIIGLKTIGDLLEHFETDMQGLGKMMGRNNLFLLIPALVFFGHKNQIRREKKLVDFDIYDVEQWLTELEKGMFNDNVQQLIIIMTETLNTHLGHLIGEGEKSKKK